jgi:hypothetical protein
MRLPGAEVGWCRVVASLPSDEECAPNESRPAVSPMPSLPQQRDEAVHRLQNFRLI